MLDTPILLIVFNRPDTTRQVFDAIRRAKPRRLFVACDGPRPNHPTDGERSERVRAITSRVDWDCDVKTLFRETNLGCGIGPAHAITWFFQHVEQGVILEDDCLPGDGFFLFCATLLEKYKHDERIQSIAGTNPFGKWSRKNESYFFSRQSGIWGWATWRRAWKEYDFYVARWGDEVVRSMFEARIPHLLEREAYRIGLEKAYSRVGVTWWDYQWIFARVISSRLGIVPSVNLVSNIGFGDGATHTHDPASALAALPLYDLPFPFVHPEAIMIDEEYDEKYSQTFYSVSSATKAQKVKTLIRKIVKTSGKKKK
ncbi:nucleotide-diphospho-sugar transferase [Chryseolinea lacunae]|uniref:Nucleotide-diphospho-sugar transferase n=1 Tax=Chryseolinea lacunae TaxID=2801331 RepID=A0ABS1KSL4_9BACT|nr:nucleotide-diphospho-sugar transferase [Chryseolinea lacunae]MBL0742454.1 nucleotide-diphospho-sugar transferase [Chryseolinea lacunae]